MDNKMLSGYLPGNSTVIFKNVNIPEPKSGQALLKMGASTICGSDIRAIYKEHLGKGPEAYQNVIAGHEPCGKIIKVGENLKRFKVNDRVIVYHISGCGMCIECRQGFMISCTSQKYRKAYGWQRDGGMAEYILVDEKDLVPLPDSLSYIDGAQIACGFATSYEGLDKINISGNDRVLVTGLGPVGLATLVLARAMGANTLYAYDPNEYRQKYVIKNKLADKVLTEKDGDLLKQLSGKIDASIDCSGNTLARQLCVRAAGQWGRICFLGEGGTLELNPSPDMLHGQKTIRGSWVSSIWKMEQLAERLVYWKIHPENLVTHIFPLKKADEAYRVMASGKSGKVAVINE